RDLLKGPVGVRRARAGERLVLLDGREVELDGEFLAITDADRPVALAGVMGGMDTRVTDATANVFLEDAHFAPAAIIGRSRRLGMHTDAAHRFERGVDPQLPRTAIEVATRLVVDIAGGCPGPVVEAALEEHLPQPRPILLRRARLARVLGLQAPDAEVALEVHLPQPRPVRPRRARRPRVLGLQAPDADVARILRALGMEVEGVAGGWRGLPPSRRFDVAIEEDLIEEGARIHGYDATP